MKPCHISLYGGDHKIAIFPNRGDHKIKYLFDRGDRKISGVKFPRFFSPLPPVVNDVSLRAPTIFHKSAKILGDKILTKILADIRGPLAPLEVGCCIEMSD